MVLLEVGVVLLELFAADDSGRPRFFLGASSSGVSAEFLEALFDPRPREGTVGVEEPDSFDGVEALESPSFPSPFLPFVVAARLTALIINLLVIFVIDGL